MDVINLFLKYVYSHCVNMLVRLMQSADASRQKHYDRVDSISHQFIHQKQNKHAVNILVAIGWRYKYITYEQKFYHKLVMYI